MSYYSCQKCGGRIIFRPRIFHKGAKRIITPRVSRVFPIHVDGCCGQTLFDFAKVS